MGKLDPGENIGYLCEMEVVTVIMDTGLEYRQVTEEVYPVEKATDLMEVEVEANGELDPDCWTSD